MRFIIHLSFFLVCSVSFAQDNVEQESSVVHKRYNSIYLGHDFFLTRSINYERNFKVGRKISLGSRVGFGNDYGNRNLSGIIEALFLYGKTRHYLEVGIGYQQPFYYFESGPDPPALALMIGYRFIGYNGFLFKVYPEFIPAVFPDEEGFGSLPFLGLAIGYSFGETSLKPAK